MSTSTVTMRASAVGCVGVRVPEAIAPRNRARADARHFDLELDALAVADRPAVLDLGAHRRQAEPVLEHERRVVDADDVAEVLFHAAVAEVQVAGIVDDASRIEVPEAQVEREATAHPGLLPLPSSYCPGHGTSTP
jgi:hypothetical protein